MFFRVLDKFFTQIKQFLSFIAFIFIAFATFYFIYWLIVSAKIMLPDGLNSFAWSVIDFFAFAIKGTPIYQNNIEVLPVYASGLFILLTYLTNCLIDLFERNHLNFKNYVNTYKLNIEKEINVKLHNDFLKELKKVNFMAIKMKVDVIKHESYLTASTDEKVDTESIKSEIQSKILESITSQYINSKSLSNNSVCILLNDLEKSQDVIVELVAKSAGIINQKISSKLNIVFYCGIEIFNDMSEFDAVSKYLDKILTLKIANKVAVTPKFKVFFENIFPNMFYFDSTGEYNVSNNPDVVKNVMFYSIRRKR